MATSPALHPRRQTTVLIGGSNGTAALTAILGDRSEPANSGHTLRVASRNPSRFADATTGRPVRWRCDEQKPFSDLVPSTMLPTSWTAHVGEPDSVFGYDDAREVRLRDGSTAMYGGLERAISGLGADDDGGAADVLVMCCPVSAHLPLLRRIAAALYRLDADGTLGGYEDASATGSRRPRRSLLVGTLYAAGGFDWMARIAFASLKPPAFSGRWSRDLALFGLKAFPYLCKSTKPGVVTMYGRYPLLTCALSPSTPRTRARATELLERVLQSGTTGKRVHFLGLSSAEHFGGDGSAEGLGTDAAAKSTYSATATAAAAATAAVIAEGKDKKGGGGGGSSEMRLLGTVPNDVLSGGGGGGGGGYSLAMSMADHADPTASLAFLTCTMNSTNQFLHPCICASLFSDPSNPSASDADGTIPWDASKESTPLPRFYADGADAEAGRLIVAIGCEEYYPVIDCLEKALAPAGMAPVSHLHGGEPVGKAILEFLGNGPEDLGRRTGLTDAVLRRLILEEEEGGAGGTESDDDDAVPIPQPVPDGAAVNRRGFFEWAMSKGLSNNTRLGSVLAPAIPLPNPDPSDKVTRRVRPNVQTRFFTDDLPHGLCIALGLAELLGFDPERDMKATLGVIRRLQRWMGKEYVVPADVAETARSGGKRVRVVADARDLGETSAPQAFGVKTVADLRNFLALSPFVDDARVLTEERLGRSALVEKNELRSRL